MSVLLQVCIILETCFYSLYCVVFSLDDCRFPDCC